MKKLFIDTNIWVYQTNLESPFYAASFQKLVNAQAEGFVLLYQYASAAGKCQGNHA